MMPEMNKKASNIIIFGFFKYFFIRFRPDRIYYKMKIQKLSIIIAAYNEGNTIHLILNKIKAVKLLDNIQKEIIIVNDFSTDHTERAIAEYQQNNPELN